MGFLSLATVMFLLLGSQLPKSTADGGVLIGDQYLTFSTEKVSWLLANERCESQNAKLVVLNNPQAFHTYVASNYRDERFWLGGSDRDNEGSWTWINGKSFSSFPWGSSQPDNYQGKEDCLEWGWQNNYNDEPCPNAQRYVCEHEERFEFFNVPGSGNQRFKYFNDAARSWYESQAKCDEEGLVLAKPKDPVAVRKHIHETFGETHAWIDGRGRGSSVEWLRAGTTIPSSDSTWWPAYPGCCQTTTHCLAMFGHWYGLRYFPNQPYYTNNCSVSIYPPTDNSGNVPYYALCEVAM